jgi:hypothetical protein
MFFSVAHSIAIWFALAILIRGRRIGHLIAKLKAAYAITN